MRQFFLIAAISGLAMACNNDTKPTATSDTTSASSPKPVTDTPAVAPTSQLKDGLMTMKDGKMMVVKSGAWATLDSAVTCTNGRKVAVDGTVVKGDKKRKLEEGMMIDKDGQLMDKDGKAMDTSGWD